MKPDEIRAEFERRIASIKATHKPTLEGMLAEVKRELALRRAVYPSFIAGGKRMSMDEAVKHWAHMSSLADFLEWCIPRAAEIRKLGGGK